MRISTGAGLRNEDLATQKVLEQIAASRSPESFADLIERCLTADYQIDRMGSVPLAIEAWADDVAGR